MSFKNEIVRRFVFKLKPGCSDPDIEEDHIVLKDFVYQVLSPEREKQQREELLLTYRHLPVSHYDPELTDYQNQLNYSKLLENPRLSALAPSETIYARNYLSTSTGCTHYLRNCSKQCFDCKKIYPCRLCHDDNEDHELPREKTEFFSCNICLKLTKPGITCELCNTKFGELYYHAADQNNLTSIFQKIIIIQYLQHIKFQNYKQVSLQRLFFNIYLCSQIFSNLKYKQDQKIDQYNELVIFKYIYFQIKLSGYQRVSYQETTYLFIRNIILILFDEKHKIILNQVINNKLFDITSALNSIVIVIFKQLTKNNKLFQTNMFFMFLYIKFLKINLYYYFRFIKCFYFLQYIRC
ncbi:CHY zinc finger domain-containing protein [Spironucleus salmonicida]|uniref:CHY zinc finger domain-containing protein n=1 Tax=Spironucleus salmonicida TaxID=348837 RepID=V6M3J1_9EUKA|nr:CHY zinc finger domain-containing protein [Spironucleus salmonicida]|eukprot:EST47859.1 CHY zinc finger domain-containing protein [Spironucleus salmonicida]